MKPLSEQTLYEILEVAENAAPSEIQKAYERARELYAPGSLATYTLMAPEEVALLGRRIEEARNVLLDPVARAGYDARLASGTPMPRTGRTSDSTPTVTATVPPGFQVESLTKPAPMPEVSAPGHAVPAAPPPPPSPEPSPEPAVAAPPAPLQAAPAPPAALVTPAPPPLVPTPAATPVPVVYSALTPAAEPATATPAAPAPAAAATRPVEKALVVPEGTPWGGELLRRAREARGLSVAQLAEKTRITRHHIENVEAERFDKLPAPVYLRGIVMSIARELRLDGQKVARSYLERVAAAPRPTR
ncbi:MAG: helix-turn-helix domain-containing protein [Deltaproteobacteria bacterium]|nr:helix-turn-helix domain-containing protein [Deltaproteobacteria bacterium]